MTGIADLAQALAALAMGIFVTGFAALMMVATVRTRGDGDVFERSWWRDELMFFLGGLFFACVGFGLIWYGTAYFVPAIAPGTLLGQDFLPGLQMIFSGLFGILFIAMALSVLFWDFVPLLARLGSLTLFGGVGLYMVWLPWLGIRDQMYGTAELPALLFSIEQVALLVEPFISFFIALVFLVMLRTDIANLFRGRLDPGRGVAVAIFSLLMQALLATAVLAFCVRVLNIEELRAASETLSSGMEHLDEFHGAAVSIYEWIFVILLALGALTQRMFRSRGGLVGIVTPGKLLLALASMVLSGLYIAEML